MAINIELFARFNVMNQYWSVLKKTPKRYLNCPIMRAASLKELKTRVIEPDLIINLKYFSPKMIIMKGFSLLFVDLYVLVRVMS